VDAERTAHLGYVKARDRRQAILKAIKQFNVPTADQPRLTAVRVFPTRTVKEKICIAFAFLGAALAGWGAIDLFYRFVGRPPGDLVSYLVAVVIFFSALGLMLKGIDQIHLERIKRELEETESSRVRRAPAEPLT
jgi:hypothetical protein